jgi:predicted DNA-binding ribbon-helix-helix protein
MKGQLRNRDQHSIRVNGQVTAITVERPVWDRLREIAMLRGVPIGVLVDEIDHTLRLDPPRPGFRRVRSLSSAVRIFVMRHS